MTTLHIESVKLSASGKRYSVKAGGKYYVAPMDIGVEQQEGKTIEAELGSFKSASGDTVLTIKGFTTTDTPKQPSLAPSPSNGHTDRWWVSFVSNQVAHAIQCGLIKEQGDLALWARAAKLAIISADQMEESDSPF